MKSISVPIELLEDMLNPCADFATHERLRARLDNQVLESQYDGMTQAQAQAVSDGVDEILHGKPPTGWLPCSPNLLESGVDCAASPRWSSKEWGGRSHWHPAPIADHTQCEECKGWGYHENHYEGGGTECGECGGSGNAPVAVVMVIPDRVKVEPFTTIDRGSKNYKAGYNAALSEVAKLNGLMP